MKRFLKDNDNIIFFLSLTIIISLILFIINKTCDLWDTEGVYVETVGGVLDIIVFGIILSIYEKRKFKRNDIKRYKEELKDYEGWDEKEAFYRVRGIINRLSLLKHTSFDFYGLIVRHISFGDVYFNGSIINSPKFESVQFNSCEIKNTKILASRDFKDIEFNWCTFDNFEIKGSKLENCRFDMQMKPDIYFSGCILHNCRFAYDENISINQFRNVLPGSLIGTIFQSEVKQKEFEKAFPDAFNEKL